MLPTRYPDALPGMLPEGLPGEQDATQVLEVVKQALHRIEQTLGKHIW